jgi:hypothetical protein
MITARFAFVLKKFYQAWQTLLPPMRPLDSLGSPAMLALDHPGVGVGKSNAGLLQGTLDMLILKAAPMIEGVSGDDRDGLVTILWRAREETRNVFVFRIGDVDRPMARLLDTAVWYKTFRLQKGARFVYRLGTNLPDPKEWDGNFGHFMGAIRKDPFNPLQFAQRYNLNPD